MFVCMRLCIYSYFFYIKRKWSNNNYFFRNNVYYEDILVADIHMLLYISYQYLVRISYYLETFLLFK
jgi:hypothetical protein